MEIELALLADKPDAIPQIAKWYSDEWGYIATDDSRSTAALESKLKDYLNRDTLPLILLASIKEGGHSKVIAAAQLRFQEMTTYPVTSHWLGGVYVNADYRGRAVGQTLLTAIIDIAKQQKITELYLQTEDHSGGLYKKMGWQPIEQVKYHNVEVLVMKLCLTEQFPR